MCRINGCKVCVRERVKEKRLTGKKKTDRKRLTWDKVGNVPGMQESLVILPTAACSFVS